MQEKGKNEKSPSPTTLKGVFVLGLVISLIGAFGLFISSYMFFVLGIGLIPLLLSVRFIRKEYVTASNYEKEVKEQKGEDIYQKKVIGLASAFLFGLLVLSNALPLAGVVYFEWRALDISLLYLAELAFLGSYFILGARMPDLGLSKWWALAMQGTARAMLIFVLVSGILSFLASYRFYADKRTRGRFDTLCDAANPRQAWN